MGSEQLLFLLSTVGVINGVLMSSYFLFVVKPKEKHNYFLGALLMMLSIRIGKSVVFYFYYDTPLMELYIHIGLGACILIGPFLYFYYKSFLQPEKKTYWIYHVGLWFFIYTIFSCSFPFFENRDLWSPYVLDIIYTQWFVYIIAAGIQLRNKVGLFPQRGQKWKSKRTWTLSIFWGISFIWASYAFCGYASYMLGAVSFTFILYLLISLLLMNTNDRVNILFTDLQKYGGRSISKENEKYILDKMRKAFQENEVYLDPEFKLKNLATLIDTNPHDLSQVINRSLNKNFSQVINEYRIEKAQVLIQENDQFTLEAIGNDCGYKSKSTFYTAFKKITGKTPAQFKKQMSKST